MSIFATTYSYGIREGKSILIGPSDQGVTLQPEVKTTYDVWSGSMNVVQKNYVAGGYPKTGTYAKEAYFFVCRTGNSYTTKIIIGNQKYTFVNTNTAPTFTLKQTTNVPDLVNKKVNYQVTWNIYCNGIASNASATYLSGKSNLAFASYKNSYYQTGITDIDF